MWWLWLVCVCGVWGAAGERDALLQALAAAGKARAALCAGSAACAGVVWSRHWLLVRASCVDNHVLAPARLLLHTEPKYCRSYVAKSDLNWPGPVMALFLHPRYYRPLGDDAAGRWATSPQPAPAQSDQFDAALILLAEAAAVPPSANQSRAYAAIPSSLVPWVRSTMAAYPGTWDRAPEPAPSVYLASSPMRLLVYTVLLPTGALLLLCVALLRGRGAPGAGAGQLYDVLRDDDDNVADEFHGKIDDELPPELRTLV